MHEERAESRSASADTTEELAGLPLVKISLNLSQDLFKSIAAVAERRRVTKTEVIRRAVSMEVFFEEARDAERGQLELFMRRQGLLQQIVFPWLQ